MSDELKVRDIDRGFFTAEDCNTDMFTVDEGERTDPLSVKQANRILRDSLAEQPEVFGEGYNDGELLPDEWERVSCEPTHSARLVGVKEIGE